MERKNSGSLHYAELRSEAVTLLISHAKSSSFKQNCHPACPGVPWDRSEAKWRDLRFLSVHPI